MKRQSKPFKILHNVVWKAGLVSLLFIGLTTELKPQDKSQPISADEQSLVVDSVAVMLKREYVFPEKANEMADLILKT